ncbi:MAG: hypothetical protein ACREJ2_04105 [Planctomycetota bacterium]
MAASPPDSQPEADGLADSRLPTPIPTRTPNPSAAPAAAAPAASPAPDDPAALDAPAAPPLQPAWKPEPREAIGSNFDALDFQWKLLRFLLTAYTLGWCVWALPAAWTRFPMGSADWPYTVWAGCMSLAMAVLLIAPYQRVLAWRMMATGGAALLPFVVVYDHYFSPNRPYMAILSLCGASFACACYMAWLEVRRLRATAPSDWPNPPAGPPPSARSVAARRVLGTSVLAVHAAYIVYHAVYYMAFNRMTLNAVRHTLVGSLFLGVYVAGVSVQRLTPRLLLYGAVSAYAIFMVPDFFMWILATSLHLPKATPRAWSHPDNLRQLGMAVMTAIGMWLSLTNLRWEIARWRARWQIATPPQEEEPLTENTGWDEAR